MTYTARTIRIIGRQQIETAINAIRSLPTGEGLEVIIRKEVKARSPDANARMWAGPLRDLAEQAFVNGQQFSADTWHEHCKRLFMPTEDHADLHRLVKDPETYRKWVYTPAGDRICVASTTQLTPYGMSDYCLQIEAMGAELGVQFSAGVMEAAQ